MENKKKIPKYSGPKRTNNKRLMTKQEIKERFDKETASIYSQSTAAWIPEYKNAMQLLVTTLMYRCPKESKFIDLGAGNGNVVLRVLENISDCHIILVDFSENMVKEAHNVLSDFPNQYSIRIADFNEMEFPSMSFDGIFSTFSIHHTRGLKAYENLYQRIFSWLKPDGIFVCCDVVEGDSPTFTKINEKGWIEFLKRHNFTQEQVSQIISNYHRKGSPISLRNNIYCLERAGFRTIEVLWKWYNFALYTSIK